jgi:TonB family protein
VRPDDLLPEFEIDPTPIWPVEDGRLEPIFLAGPLWVEFEDLDQPDPTLALGAPLLVEYDEIQELDPERTEAELVKPPPAPRQRASAISLFGSLGVHLLPLLVLISWSSAPAEIAGAMPVQLVFEKPPPEPEPEEATPTPSQLVPETRTISEKPSEPASRAAGARTSPSASPPQTTLAGVVSQPPKPAPPPKPMPIQPAAMPLPKAAPPPKPAPIQPAAMPLPKAAPPPKPAPPPGAAAPRLEARPNPAPHEGQVPGPDTARADYFATLVTLTQRHFDILPPAFLAGRRGETILRILVLNDGTIIRIAVSRSSGYPDIDGKIEQMVAAVGRFPPLPPALSVPSLDVELRLFFPEALLEH